jgi:hypothetical protein
LTVFLRALAVTVWILAHCIDVIRIDVSTIEKVGRRKKGNLTRIGEKRNAIRTRKIS